MDNIELKLGNNSKNPIVISQIFFGLVQNALEKNNGNNNNNKEFQYLKEKCLNEYGLINDIARISIIKLIETGNLSINEILTDFIASLTNAKNVISITKLIIALIKLGLSKNLNNKNSSATKYEYELSQHPLIKILIEDHHLDVQMCIYSEILQSLNNFDDRLSPQLERFYKPLYLYCICSPILKLELNFLREKIWKYFIKSNSFRYETTGTGIQVLCYWLQVENKNAQYVGSLLNEVLNEAHSTKSFDYTIPLQVLTIRSLILQNINCNLEIQDFLRILSNNKATCYTNVFIYILTNSLIMASPECFEELLKLCLYLVSKSNCNLHYFLALESILIHWLANRNILTSTSLDCIEKIRCLAEEMQKKIPPNICRFNIEKFHHIFFCNPELFLTLQMESKLRSIDRVKRCEKDREIIKLIKELDNVPFNILKQNFALLCGILLNKKFNSVDQIQTLKLIMKCSSNNLQLMPYVLTLILYKLSNHLNEDSKLDFALLKALPLTAKLKENTTKIVATLKAISQQSVLLNNLCLRLLYDTWEIDNSCYPALENALQECSTISTMEKIHTNERNITKAYIFQQVALKRPELHGKELVIQLSKILNDCTSSDGALATSLALEGIAYLCRADIIDIITTWNTLHPKFFSDTRVIVRQSFCKLLCEIPKLEYTQSNEKFNEDVIKYLWNYVVNSDNEEIVNAAFNALSEFGLELISPHFPNLYRDKNLNSAVEALLIPGKFWIKLLDAHKFKDATRNFLIKLVSTEISTYLKYVYHIKSRKEPDSYNGLPTHSVVRALGEHLKRNFHKTSKRTNTSDEELYANCLKILSLRYSKPLPPLDWCFLQELVHVDSLRKYCINLASHQAMLSGSARRLMENYIFAVTTEDLSPLKIMDVYRNLKYLANTIQPVILKPFFQSTLKDIEENLENFEKYVKFLKEILNSEDIQDVNKNVIEEVFTELVFLYSTNSKVFPLLQNCVSSFSSNGKTTILEFKADLVTEEEFLKISKLRCDIVKNSSNGTTLNLLNPIFKTAFKNNFDINILNDDLEECFKSQINYEESATWLNELLGEIQVKVADRCDEKEIHFYCEILTNAVVHFSGLYSVITSYETFRRKYYFPAALAYLMDNSVWNYYIIQICEWLYFMNKSDNVPEEFRHIFGWSLCSLRHQDEFAKSSRWMKYFNCNLHTNVLTFYL